MPRKNEIPTEQERLLRWVDDFRDWLEEEMNWYGRINEPGTKQFVDAIWLAVGNYNSVMERKRAERKEVKDAGQK